MKKFDVVFEAMRYKNGKIDIVRVYERRGPTFSDRLLVDRKSLLERLKAGKKRVVTGQRKALLASTFEVGKAVQVLENDGKQVITTLAQGDHDELEGVPVF
ncbi:MAG: hypothetical protein ACM3MF_01995 [Anaerolineae bacterium]